MQYSNRQRSGLLWPRHVTRGSCNLQLTTCKPYNASKARLRQQTSSVKQNAQHQIACFACNGDASNILRPKQHSWALTIQLYQLFAQTGSLLMNFSLVGSYRLSGFSISTLIVLELKLDLALGQSILHFVTKHWKQVSYWPEMTSAKPTISLLFNIITTHEMTNIINIWKIGKVSCIVLSLTLQIVKTRNGEMVGNHGNQAARLHWFEQGFKILFSWYQSFPTNMGRWISWRSDMARWRRGCINFLDEW